jgi:hypothetical protein
LRSWRYFGGRRSLSAPENGVSGPGTSTIEASRGTSPTVARSSARTSKLRLRSLSRKERHPADRRRVFHAEFAVAFGHVTDGRLVFGDFDQRRRHGFLAAEGAVLVHEVAVVEVFGPAAAGQRQGDRRFRRAVPARDLGQEGRVAAAAGQLDREPAAALASALDDVGVEQALAAGRVRRITASSALSPVSTTARTQPRERAAPEGAAAAGGAHGLDRFRGEGVAAVGGDVAAHAELRGSEERA